MFDTCLHVNRGVSVTYLVTHLLELLQLLLSIDFCGFGVKLYYFFVAKQNIIEMECASVVQNRGADHF